MNLITTKKNLEKQVSDLNVVIVKNRGLVISAIEELVEKYVVPAVSVGSLNSDSIYTFDLDEIAGTEIHNLMLSLFESKMNGLHKPSMQELQEAIDSIGIRGLSEEERNRFYQVWAGEKAVEAITFLAKLLFDEKNKAENSQASKSQDEKIKRLFKFNLPESVLSILKMILATDSLIISQKTKF